MAKTKFAIGKKKNGKLVETKTMTIDISKIKSPDPLAYAYGLFQGRSGQKKPKDKNLAPEYLRGYREGRKKLKKLA